MKPVSFILGLGFVLILLSSCSQVTNQSDSNLDPKLYGEWICDTLTDSRDYDGFTFTSDGNAVYFSIDTATNYMEVGGIYEWYVVGDLIHFFGTQDLILEYSVQGQELILTNGDLISIAYFKQ